MHSKAIAFQHLSDAQTLPQQGQPPPTSSPAVWLPSTAWHAVGHPSGQGGVSCPGCVPSQHLGHPQPAGWRGSRRSTTALDAVPALLSKN